VFKVEGDQTLPGKTSSVRSHCLRPVLVFTTGEQDPGHDGPPIPVDGSEFIEVLVVRTDEELQVHVGGMKVWWV
jgi:hypothetical protein